MLRSPLLLLIALFAVSSPALAQKKVKCKKDLKEASEFIYDMWSFRLFKPGAADVAAKYAQLEPLAKRAKTPAECADVIARFMAHLHDGHSSLHYYPDLDYTAPRLVLRSQREQLSSLPGQDPRVHVYVFARDTTDSTVARVSVGSQILAVDGEPIADLFARIEDRVSGSTLQWRDYMCDRKLLLGSADSELEIEYRTAVGVRKTTTAKRPSVEEYREWMSSLGEDDEHTRWERLESGWGYIRYPSFSIGRLDQTKREFDDAVDALLDSPGLILDLRGNGGGYVDAATSAAGRFVDRDVLFGYYQVRRPGQEEILEVYDEHTGSITARPSLEAKPRKKVFDGPVVILIDRACFSACESFTAGLQDLNRALVVGTSATGGGSGFVTGLELPSGAMISFSWTVAWRPSGQQIEGNGVAPDVRLVERPRDWISGRDRVLERAVRALEAGEARTLADLTPLDNQ